MQERERVTGKHDQWEALELSLELSPCCCLWLARGAPLMTLPLTLLSVQQLASLATYSQNRYTLDLLQVNLSKFLKSEQSELQRMRLRSDQASDEVSRSTCFTWMDLNHFINSRKEKMVDIKIMSCQKRHVITLSVLLVNCHDVSSRIFHWWILRQTVMKSPLEQHKTTRKKNKGRLESLVIPRYLSNWGFSKGGC